MIYFRNKSNQNRKILKWLKSKSLKNDLNRDLNHIRFKSPMILTTLQIIIETYLTTEINYSKLTEKVWRKSIQ
jgi:hypothetical protein